MICPNSCPLEPEERQMILEALDFYQQEQAFGAGEGEKVDDLISRLEDEWEHDDFAK